MLEKQVADMRDRPARVTNLESQFLQFRQEVRDGFSAIRSEMKSGFAELGAQMRALHEDAIQRIATIAEGRRSRKK